MLTNNLLYPQNNKLILVGESTKSDNCRARNLTTLPFYMIELMIVDEYTIPTVQFVIDSIYERESWINLNGLELPKHNNTIMLRRNRGNILEIYFAPPL